MIEIGDEGRIEEFIGSLEQPSFVAEAAIPRRNSRSVSNRIGKDF